MNINSKDMWLMNKISVVIPTYNREKTIDYCLKSVLSQTFKPYEIIIVDDCSTDKTLEIVKKFNNPIIKIFKLDRNLGAQSARNRGIKEANGEWIAFLDSDDEWIEDKLEKQLTKAKMEDLKVIYCECLVKEDDKTYKFNTPNYEKETYNNLLRSPGPTFPGLLVKKECFNNLGLLDENVPSYQEWDTSIYLSKYYNFGFIKEPLFIYNLHKGETISKNSYRAAEGWAYIVDKYYDEIKQALGIESLINHYDIIIDKFDKINDANKCLEYEKKLIDLKYEARKIYRLHYNNHLSKDSKQLIDVYKNYYLMYNKWIDNLHNRKYLGNYMLKNNFKNVSIYGTGEVAIRLYKELKNSEVKIKHFIVQSIENSNFIDNISIVEADKISNINSNLIIVTPIYDFENIKKDLFNYGFDNIVVSLQQIINEIE